MSDEAGDGFLLLSGLVLLDVASSSDGGDAGLVAVGSCDTLGKGATERTAAEVAAASLERENVGLRVGRSSRATDDDWHWLEGTGGSDETKSELLNLGQLLNFISCLLQASILIYSKMLPSFFSQK